ncbi:hypothetical protein [Lacticaseibacillus paracasei]|nr:hypothetical protein [Lacticaseibacillus paracasei]EKQ09108.1 hypothetical protein LCAM36_2380 [Lacticaseibacillus paracasei]EPC23806.1 hypothetical protein Lpp17_2084 [Lacticaseibacillus paracasei subsp. paracasei Lpp17]EPC36152.1 hypothetical protein Lpp120_0479 [Lacticaseibacillus paracasei subsp. paracasei Lpp120]QHV91406.1 hypothetical protein EOK76_g0941 [Lacticaseibacillus paracasei]
MQKVGRAATSLNCRDASSDLSETLDVEYHLISMPWRSLLSILLSVA